LQKSPGFAANCQFIRFIAGLSLWQNFGYPVLLIFFLHFWLWLCSDYCCSGLVAGPPAITGKTLFIGAGGDRVTILKLPSLQISVYLMAFA